MRATLRRLRALGRDTRGLAMIEFAFTTPLVLLAGIYGVEISNYALANLRVSQIALSLADNASRVGLNGTNGIQQLREVDLIDALQASRIQGGDRLNLGRYGRITLSSLEAAADGTQRIHWQRCLGMKSEAAFTSHFGITPITAGGDANPGNEGTLAPTGMGPADAPVNAPPSSGVMFVEVNYLYQPLFGDWLLGQRRIHYIASFIVRDRRDFTQIFNPGNTVSAADKLTCNRFTS